MATDTKHSYTKATNTTHYYSKVVHMATDTNHSYTMVVHMATEAKNSYAKVVHVATDTNHSYTIVVHMATTAKTDKRQCLFKGSSSIESMDKHLIPQFAVGCHSLTITYVSPFSTHLYPLLTYFISQSAHPVAVFKLTVQSQIVHTVRPSLPFVVVGYILHGYFTDTGTIARLPRCQGNKFNKTACILYVIYRISTCTWLQKRHGILMH